MSQTPEIDWTLTTWEGVRRAQLLRNLQLTVAERFRALEEMSELSREFAKLRQQGKFSTPEKKKP